MRIPALVILLLIFNKGVFSQASYNVAFHDISENPVSNVEMIHGEPYFLTQVTDHMNFGSTYVNKYSVSGQKRFHQYFHGEFYGSVFESLDHKLVIWGTNGTCDVVDTAHIRERICKMDTNGTVIFNTAINLYPHGGWDVLKAVFQYTDSTYFAFSDSILIKLDKNGLFLSKTILSFKDINSAVLLQNGNIVVARGYPWTSSSLVTINSSGQVLNIKPMANPLVNIKTFAGGQRVVGIDWSGMLHKFSNNLDLTASTSNTTIFYRSFLVDSDTIYTIENTDFKCLDSSFNQLSVSTCTTQQLVQRSLCKSGNLLAVLSSCSRAGQVLGQAMDFTALNVFTKSQSNNFNLDIELYDLVADSSYAIQPFSFGYMYYYLRAKVKVVNKSNKVIHKLSLSTHLFTYVVCGEEYYKQDFEGLNLQPGDTMVLTTNFIETRGYAPPTGSIVAYSWCLNTTCPNGENDKVAENDRACKTFTAVLTDLSEFNPKEDRVMVFPNPFSSTFNIQSEFEMEEVKVFNALGVLIRRETSQGKEMLLNLPELEPGIYFVRIETEKGAVTKKLIKE